MIEAALAHGVPRPVDGHRHDRRLAFQRHDEPALLERQEGAGPAARALGEDQERVAGAQRLGGALDRRQALLGIAALERHEASQIERRTRTGSFRSSAL